MSWRLVRTSMAAVVLVAGACATDDDGAGSTVPDGDLSQRQREHAEQIEAVLLRYEEGWTDGDAERIASFLDDDGFVFNEPRSVNLDKDEFMDLMRPFIGDPDVASTDIHYFVGDDEVVSVAQAWGFGGGTSAENPVVEVDVFTVSDDEITSLRSMYGAQFVRRWAGVEGAEDAVAAYASAWSSGDVSAVAALYADGAARSEPLYGDRQQGTDEIAREAQARFDRHPDLSLDIVEPYVFASADTLGQTFGAMFAVGDGEGDGLTCKVLVLLEPNEAGEIVGEEVYFHTETLGSCDR